MAQLRIALAQVNPTVGDLSANAELIVDRTVHARQRGAHLVIFPEMMLTGYPVEDLALRKSFVDASRTSLLSAARRLEASGAGDVPVVTGYLDRRPDAAPAPGLPAGAPENAAAVLYGGDIATRAVKHHLPNYGVFDEFRYFVRGERVPVFRLHGVDCAVAICEDLWQEGGPVQAAKAAGAGLLAVPNASPYELGKDATRLDLIRRRAIEAGAALAYVNLVGGQDELVFDGGSVIVDATGTVVGGAPRFEEACTLIDMELPLAGTQPAAAEQPPDAGKPASVDAPSASSRDRMDIERVTLTSNPVPEYAPCPPPEREVTDQLAQVYTALVTATGDYARKNGFATALVSLSGGIDSALAATIAADALGPERVHVVLLPSQHSSEHSITDAEELVKRQRLRQQLVAIAPVVDAYEAQLDLHGVAAENLQARARAVVVMALSNEHGHLVLATGNKSELAVGYSTLYGDTVGGYAPLKDVPKTVVWELSRWRNRRAEARGETPPVPENSITKAPSAELRPGQRDVDSLPDYSVLDPLLDDYIERDMARDALIAAGHDPATVDDVIRRVDAAEYKRRQYPPGPKISLKAFGRDRRLPITSRWREPGH